MYFLFSNYIYRKVCIIRSIMYLFYYSFCFLDIVIFSILIYIIRQYSNSSIYYYFCFLDIVIFSILIYYTSKYSSIFSLSLLIQYVLFKDLKFSLCAYIYVFSKRYGRQRHAQQKRRCVK